MAGLLENELIQRFGPQKLSTSGSVTEHCWNVDDESRKCILYKTLRWNHRLRRKYGILETLYSDSKGGFVLGDSLRLSILDGSRIFGLYLIEELQERPEVKRASECDPEICYFMDSANVWFYGLKNGELFVYDSSFDELDSLGPAHSAIQQLLVEYD